MIRKISTLATRPFAKPIEGLVVPISRQDKYRQNGGWRPAQPPILPPVEAFSLHGRYTFQIGDGVEVHNNKHEIIGRGIIQLIRAVDLGAMADDDLALLGYDHEHWIADWSALKRLGWLIEVVPIKAEEG